MAFVALEQYEPVAQRLVCDELAVRLLPPAARRVIHACRWRPARQLLLRLAEQQAPGIRGATLCRKRYADDRLVEAIADGLPQLVVLGAGFDTRPYRLAAPAGMGSFEVDLPANSGAKRKRLHEVYGRLPDRVKLVPLDLESGDVGAALDAHGFQIDQPSVFVWEAVSQYLTEAGVHATLTFLARTAPASRFIFTFVRQDFLDGRNLYDAETLYRDFVVRHHTWHFGIAPDRVAGLLAAYGWLEREQVGRFDYERRYLAPIGRTLGVSEIERAGYAEKR
jgi:methyltransferase (TIGR00027 family)